MKVTIDKLNAQEGGDIEIVLLVDRPAIPWKSTYSDDETKKFEEDRKAFTEEVLQFEALHLGEAELTQEATG